MKAKPAPQFWVIDPESPGESANSVSAIGPFKSIAAAEKHLIRDVIETYQHSDDKVCDAVRPEADRKWARPVHIVRLVKTVQQIPTVFVGGMLLHVP